jgi:hypothetical protein
MPTYGFQEWPSTFFFSLDLLGKLIMLDFEPLDPARGSNPSKAAIVEEKYIYVHINSR